MRKKKDKVQFEFFCCLNITKTPLNISHMNPFLGYNSANIAIKFKQVKGIPGATHCLTMLHIMNGRYSETAKTNQ